MSFRTGKYLAVTAVAATIAFLGAPAHHAGHASADGSMTVQMVSNTYQPGTLTVSAGTTVIWENDEDPNGTDVTHDIISDDNVTLASDYLSPGQTYAVTLTTPGTYHYLCDLHNGMEGTVIVQ